MVVSGDWTTANLGPCLWPTSSHYPSVIYPQSLHAKTSTHCPMPTIPLLRALNLSALWPQTLCPMPTVPLLHAHVPLFCCMLTIPLSLLQDPSFPCTQSLCLLLNIPLSHAQDPQLNDHNPSVPFQRFLHPMQTSLELFAHVYNPLSRSCFTTERKMFKNLKLP